MKHICLTLLAVTALTTFPVLADNAPQFSATLKERAVLPAQTFIVMPEDAPAAMNSAGRFVGGECNEQMNSLIEKASGLVMPYAGQALQGFSGIRSLGNDRFLVLTDNGFGTKANSYDAALMFHIFKMDWKAGRPQHEKTVFLKDPNRKVPFPIVNEHSKERYLTGADFDPESIQPIGDHYWIGEEFGPFLVEVDQNGVVLQVIKTVVNGVKHQSPDNPYLKLPVPGGEVKGVNSGRSGGYEGMAQSPDGSKLYPLLEKAFYDEATKSFENKSGKSVLRMFEFDVKTTQWSDKIRYYPLEDAANAIGDFNMIDANRGMIIERVSFEGDPRDASIEKPARFKRVYLVDINQTDTNGVVKKLGYIDLMAIKDPTSKGGSATKDGIFNFPFVTIENVDLVDTNTIIIGNDNNYSFSTGRQKNVADNNEFILLDVKDFLQQK